MSSLRVVLIEGDGIGPELAAAARAVIDATGVAVEWEERVAGTEALAAHGHVAPRDTIEAVASARSALKGPTATPSGGGHRSANYYLRHGLDLFGGVRRFVDPARDVDLILVRENLEDLYAAEEWEPEPGVAHALRVVTERGSQRIAKLAFEIAERRHRPRLTIVHKANNLKLGDGLFLRTARAVAREHPSVSADDMLADTAGAAVVTSPAELDVLLTGYTFGDILSSVAAAACGGPALVSTLNVGPDAVAVAEAGHGTAPDIAGKGRANPLGFVGGAAMLLEARGFEREAAAVHEACAAVRVDGAVTPDLGGDATTREVAETLAADVRVRLQS